MVRTSDNAPPLNNPAKIYLLKVNNRNTRPRCEICFTPCSIVPIVNFERVIAGWKGVTPFAGHV